MNLATLFVTLLSEPKVLKLMDNVGRLEHFPILHVETITDNNY